MRKQDSLFNAVVEFVNEQPIGSTFSTQEYLNRVSGFETITGWKSLTRNANYRAHMYKGMMKMYFLTNTKRGSWTVTRHIPDWFTSAHLWTLNGYTTSDTYTKDGKWATANRTKLSKDEIALKLTAEDINTIVTKLANGLADESVIGNALLVTDEKLNEKISQLKYPGEERANEKRVTIEVTLNDNTK